MTGVERTTVPTLDIINYHSNISLKENIAKQVDRSLPVIWISVQLDIAKTSMLGKL